MKQCRLTAARPAPGPALPALPGSRQSFARQIAHDGCHALPPTSSPFCRPSQTPVNRGSCNQKRRALRLFLSLAPFDGERGTRPPTRHQGPSTSLNNHRPLSKNDHASPPAYPASMPSPSPAFSHRATPSFDPETRLKRVETTLKWLETRLKRLEINVETLKRFNQFKNSASRYQRLTQIAPLKREKNLKRTSKTTPPPPAFRARRTRVFQEILWPFGARIFAFWRGFGEGACPHWPVTEPKRSPNAKRPLLERLQYFLKRSSGRFPCQRFAETGTVASGTDFRIEGG